ncbi:hypothetical protein QJQ45_008682 [Haematococcus lacustris]|nr:hypothetical protein QJQ45_008682 [Haematococcus lacustris]
MQSPCAVVELAEQPMCCDVSPLNQAAAGLVSGELTVHNFSYTHSVTPRVSHSLAFSKTVHNDSCRAVQFTLDGLHLVTAGQDRKLIALDSNTGKQAWCQDAAHDSPISMLRILAVSPLGTSYNSSMPAGQAGGSWAAGSGMAVSGDEDGVVKVWDQRSRKQVMAYRKHTDFISDAALQPQEAALVVSSGDGTLSVHDLRACRLRAHSETDADDELLSVVVMKGGKKVVAGCQSGALALFSWGCFKDCSDRFTGHPDSVDALVAFDEDTLLSGSSDGLLRVLGLLPNKLLGVLGGHAEDFPVEALSLSHDRHVLASISHDPTLRLWDLAVMHDDDDGEDEVDEDGAAGGSDGPNHGVRAGVVSGSSSEGEGEGGEVAAVAGRPGAQSGTGQRKQQVRSAVQGMVSTGGVREGGWEQGCAQGSDGDESGSEADDSEGQGEEEEEEEEGEEEEEEEGEEEEEEGEEEDGGVQGGRKGEEEGRGNGVEVGLAQGGGFVCDQSKGQVRERGRREGAVQGEIVGGRGAGVSMGGMAGGSKQGHQPRAAEPCSPAGAATSSCPRSNGEPPASASAHSKVEAAGVQSVRQRVTPKLGGRQQHAKQQQGGGSDEDGSSEGEGASSEDDHRSKSKKRREREKTKWTKQKDQKQKTNFFSDLL